MSVNEIAARLVELCRQGKFETAQRELFAQDAVSVEPYSTPAFEKETNGLDAIIEKGNRWDEMVLETHSLTVSEPLVAGNCFACSLRMDLTMKEQGRMEITELCVYQVKDGRIISEQFFM